MEQLQDITSPMTRQERRATLSLAAIYALRMLGLFMLLPVLSLFAEQMPGATPVLIGLAISIYGLSQALLQIPFGMLSDRFGRKKIIIIGLSLFFVGSVTAALSTTIYGILAGRALQGAGAIAAAIMALLADLTQEVHRTKAMATIGASIGVAFGISITFGPILASFLGISGIFWLTAGLALVAAFVVMFIVPNPEKSCLHRDAEVDPRQFVQVLTNPQLLRLDYGIFILHLCLTSCFVVLPLLIRDAGFAAQEHWKIYLPILVTSMALIVPFVIIAEKKRKMKPVFIGAIITVALANLGLFFFAESWVGLVLFLWLFFCGFNLLEATLPSLISKTAPGDHKGTAMGAYSSSQFLGAFTGGAAGGWIYGELGMAFVFLFASIATLSWAVWAWSMQSPRYLANMLIPLRRDEAGYEAFIAALSAVEGIEDVVLQTEEGVAYLKVDKQRLQTDILQQVLNQRFK